MNWKKWKLILWLLLFAPLFAFGQTNEIVVVPVVTPPAPAESASLLALINAMVEQIINSPASLLVIIALSIISYVVEVSAWLPSKAILPLCVFGGASGYWIFSSAGSVSPYFPYPYAVLVVNGLVCGFIAFIFHASAIKWLINRFQPPSRDSKDPKPPTPDVPQAPPGN